MSTLFKDKILQPDGMAVLIEQNSQQETNTDACPIYYTSTLSDIGKSLNKLNSMKNGEAFVLNLWYSGHWTPIKFEKSDNVNHIIVADSFATKGFDPDEIKQTKEKILTIDKWARSNEIMSEILSTARKNNIQKTTKVYCNTFSIQADGTNCGIYCFKTGKKLSRTKSVHEIIQQEKYQGSFKDKKHVMDNKTGIEVMGFILPEKFVGLAHFTIKPEQLKSIRQTYKDRISYKDEIVRKNKAGKTQTLDEYWTNRGLKSEDPVTFFRNKYQEYFDKLNKNNQINSLVEFSRKKWDINNLFEPKKIEQKQEQKLQELQEPKKIPEVTSTAFTISKQQPTNPKVTEEDIVQKVTQLGKTLSDPNSIKEIKALLPGLKPNDTILGVANKNIRVQPEGGRPSWKPISDFQRKAPHPKLG